MALKREEFRLTVLFGIAELFYNGNRLYLIVGVESGKQHSFISWNPYVMTLITSNITPLTDLCLKKAARKNLAHYRLRLP